MTDAAQLETVVIQGVDGSVYAVPIRLIDRYAIDPAKVDEVLEQAGGDEVAGHGWTGGSYQLVGQYSFTSTDAMTATYLPGDQFVPGDQFIPGDQFLRGDQFQK